MDTAMDVRCWLTLTNGWTVSVSPDDTPPALCSVAAWPTVLNDKPVPLASWFDFDGRLDQRCWTFADVRQALNRVEAAPPPVEGCPAGPPRAQEGEPLRWLTEVALNHTGDDCLLWPFSLRPNGYGQVRSGGTTQIASRVVCEAVNGPPPSPDHQAAHSCGVRACCNPSHLRWATRLENMADMAGHGMLARGERNGSATLTEGDVRVVRQRLAAGDMQKSIAESFGVGRHTINAIATGRTWAWLE